MDHPAIRYTVDGGGLPYIHNSAGPAFTGRPLFYIEEPSAADEKKEELQL